MEHSTLGSFQLCLKVKDLVASRAWYARLGFRDVGGKPEDGYLIVRNGDCCLGLFQGHIRSNLLNFRGGDVFALAKQLKGKGVSMKKEPWQDKDGCRSALLEDPDGNVIFLDTAPGETPDGQIRG